MPLSFSSNKIQVWALERLKANPSGKALSAFNFLLKQMIPFNSPHGIEVSLISENEVVARLPFRKSNWNHLKGAHATAIATVGEFSAGVALLLDFPGHEYRLILAQLSIDYHLQGKSTLLSKTQKILPASLNESLKSIGKVTVELVSEIIDENEHKVATVKSTWQIKKWAQIQAKHSNKIKE